MCQAISIQMEACHTMSVDNWSQLARLVMERRRSMPQYSLEYPDGPGLYDRIHVHQYQNSSVSNWRDNRRAATMPSSSCSAIRGQMRAAINTASFASVEFAASMSATYRRSLTDNLVESAIGIEIGDHHTSSWVRKQLRRWRMCRRLRALRRTFQFTTTATRSRRSCKIG